LSRHGTVSYFVKAQSHSNVAKEDRADGLFPPRKLQFCVHPITEFFLFFLISLRSGSATAETVRRESAIAIMADRGPLPPP
jgi:hypothetical protein